MWNKMKMSQLDATLTRVPLTLTFDLEFSRSIVSREWNFRVKYGFCYISAKNGSIGTENWHIDWMLGLKCDHRVWPWSWPWPWLFKVKYVICCISAKMVWLPRNDKQTYRLNSRPQRWPWPWKVRWEDLTNSDWGDFKCRRDVDSSSLYY